MVDISYKAKLKNKESLIEVAQKRFNPDGSSYFVLMDSDLLMEKGSTQIQSEPVEDYSIRNVRDLHTKLSEQYFFKTGLRSITDINI